MKNKLALIFIILISINSFSSSYRGKLIAEDKYLTVDFKEVPITDVIRIIGRKFDINLIAGDKVTGKVTVSFDNVLVDDALESILSINGYTYVKVGNIIKVVSMEQASREFKAREKVEIEKLEPKINKTYYLEYADVQDVKNMIIELTDEDSKVIADSKTNNVIVWIKESQEEMIDNLVNQIDIPQATPTKKSSAIIQVNYLEINKLVNLIEDILGKTSSIKVNEAINSLIIFGEDKEIKEIKKIVKRYDVPPLQVSIEVNLIEKSLGNDKNKGINWKYINENESGDNRFEIEVGDRNISGRNSDGLEFKLGMLDINNFNMVLQNLLTDTDAKLLSSPNITTLNERKATIHLGDKIPYKETSGTDSETESYKFESVGIKLEVTPKILEDGRINLQVMPEVSSVSEYTPDNVPIISTRTAETNVIVKDGETLVIGGLIKNEKTTIITSIPILGQIPIIGQFFQSKINQNQKVNLMVFIKSNIIRTRPLFNEDIIDAENIKKNENKIEEDKSNEEYLKEEASKLKEENIDMSSLRNLIGGE